MTYTQDLQNLVRGDRRDRSEIRQLIVRSSIRGKELTTSSGLQLASLFIDYGLILDEAADPIEVILDYEFQFPTAPAHTSRGIAAQRLSTFARAR